MGFFSGKRTVTPATGFYAMPGSYQNAYNNTLTAGNNLFYGNNGQLNTSMFTPSGTGFQSMLEGFTPDATQLEADIALQTNPYDKFVTDEINRQAGGQFSMLGRGLSQAGQFGSNRGLLGANDIDISRLNQIGSFKQQNFNQALQNALSTLPGLRAQDAQMNFDATMQAQQAPYTALQAAQAFINQTPTSFGNFGTPQYSTKSGFGLSGLMNLAKTAGQAYMAFSDRTIKENIIPAGIESGFNVYEFNYIGEPDKKYIGVIAQEVQEIDPSAVVDMNGILAVDYNKIGVEFREAA